MPLLRPLIDEVRSVLFTKDFVAITLINIQGASGPGSWVQSENPVLLRAVVGRAISAIRNGKPTHRCKKLLSGKEGHVRKEAINNVSDNPAPIVEQLLTGRWRAPGLDVRLVPQRDPDGRSMTRTKEAGYSGNRRPDGVALSAAGPRNRSGRGPGQIGGEVVESLDPAR